MKILTLYDGTLHAKIALTYGIRKVRESGGEVVALHIFDTARFVDYDAGPKAEVLARSEAIRRLEEAKKIINETASGIRTRIISAEGDVEHLTIQYAKSERADLLLAPQRYKGVVKAAPCPVYLIPGTILVPVDSTDNQLENMGRLREEAAATGARVVLLGIVPVHLYSREEKQELDMVKKETSARMNRIDAMLSGQGIETKKITRSGYPDEEIVKAAEEYSASLIIMPAGGDSPSELTKAVAIILDEPKRIKGPLMLLPQTVSV